MREVAIRDEIGAATIKQADIIDIHDALIGWMFLSALFALHVGFPWQPLAGHDPTVFLHALILACIAAGVLRWRSASWQLPLLAAQAVAINALTQGKGVYLEGVYPF